MKGVPINLLTSQVFIPDQEAHGDNIKGLTHDQWNILKRNKHFSELHLDIGTER